jgi:subtilisin family serine protease
VAGTIGAAINGLGMAGVAPGVELVNIRSGQDSGYFFLEPMVDAFTYAGDNDIDVVNMSFFVDPWLFNCRNNPADSPEDQLEQRTIIEATNRAAYYARQRGVTLIAAEGNQHIDLTYPTVDTISPDFPPGEEYPRDIDNSCVTLPVENGMVIGVTSVGPSGIKADYSSYGIEQADVSAPGGYFRDFFGTPDYMQPTNLILSAYPESVGRADGAIDEDGNPTTPFVVKDCDGGGTCAYYQYISGTSMAAPHAVGVAALIVSNLGQTGGADGGLRLQPKTTQDVLYATATDTPCPAGGVIDYPDRDETYTAVCEGTTARNGLYGEGLVNALAAVQYSRSK